jgi:hypothetical protein
VEPASRRTRWSNPREDSRHSRVLPPAFARTFWQPGMRITLTSSRPRSIGEWTLSSGRARTPWPSVTDDGGHKSSTSRTSCLPIFRKRHRDQGSPIRTTRSVRHSLQSRVSVPTREPRVTRFDGAQRSCAPCCRGLAWHRDGPNPSAQRPLLKLRAYPEPRRRTAGQRVGACGALGGGVPTSV